MPEQDTWETASVETPIIPPAPETQLQVAPETPEPAPEPAVTLEKPDAPQVEPAEVAARESEAPEQITQESEVKDEYIAEPDDPPEIAALQTPAAKRWAKRQHKDAAAVRAFDDFDTPISDVGDQLFARSQSRYTEHVLDIFKRHAPDLLGAPFDEVKSRLQANGTPATTPKPATQNISEVSLPTAAELETMSNEEVAQRFQQVREQEEKRLSAEFQKKFDDFQKQLEDVNGKLTTKEQAEQQAEISQKQDELYSKVWSEVDEVIRNSGLEANPADPPKIAGLKEAARDLLSRDSVERAFDASEDNRKVVQYVVEATKRREFQNAFREVDNLKVRARAAAESIKKSAKMKAILDEIEAYANQSNGKSRATDPIPPAPGSSVGVTIKPPTTWDEAERAVA